MRMRAVVPAFLLVLLFARIDAAGATAPPEVQAILAKPLQQLQTADYRATGHLVRIGSDGTRTSDALTLKVRWFPGVLRVLLEIEASGKVRSHVLIEMRPEGKSSILIAHPGDTAPVALPFDQWTNGPLGPGFSFEDFLEPQIFWPSQTVQPNVLYGARNCDLLTSAPGTLERTHYSKVKSWLDHAIGYPVYLEKTLKGTGTIKEFTYFGLRQSGGVWSASQVEEKTRGQNGSALLIIERGSTKANLDLKDFGPEQLMHF